MLNLVANDIVKLIPQCNKVFDSLQKLYVHIEGSPKRHSEYMLCISNLNLDDGIKVLQSLSTTRWASRNINLRIVHRCLPAIIKFLEEDRTSESKGLLNAIKNIKVSFWLIIFERFVSGY